MKFKFRVIIGFFLTTMLLTFLVITGIQQYNNVGNQIRGPMENNSTYVPDDDYTSPAINTEETTPLNTTIITDEANLDVEATEETTPEETTTLDMIIITDEANVNYKTTEATKPEETTTLNMTIITEKANVNYKTTEETKPEETTTLNMTIITEKANLYYKTTEETKSEEKTTSFATNIADLTTVYNVKNTTSLINNYKTTTSNDTSTISLLITHPPKNISISSQTSSLRPNSDLYSHITTQNNNQIIVESTKKPILLRKNNTFASEEPGYVASGDGEDEYSTQ